MKIIQKICTVIVLCCIVRVAFSQEQPIRMQKCDVTDQRILTFRFINESGKTVENIRFTLTDGKGKTYGKVTRDLLYPQKDFRVEFPLPGKDVYTLFSQGLPVVSYKSKNVSGQFVIPAEMKLLAIARGAKSEPDPEVAVSGDKLDATIAVYNNIVYEGNPMWELINRKYTMVDSAYPDLANRMLPVMLGEDSASKKDALQTMINEITKDRKDYTDKSIYLVSHAHQDIYWLWGHQESVKMMQDNLRQAVAFLEEFPQYRFSQSQAAIYREIEQSDPVTFEKIKKYVAEGRFELLGGEWSEGDTNLSSGEAIVRSFLLGQRFFQSRFGKMAKVGWLPDNFGHAAQFPQLLNQAGINSFYFHRCSPYKGSFVWEGLDGSKVLGYSNMMYGTYLPNAIVDEFEQLIPKQDRLLHVLGVGDHGGGPTRMDIQTERDMQKVDRFPSIQFTSAEQFFKDAYKDVDTYPVHKGEMQYVFEGCYTSNAWIKEGNRNGEAQLFESEVLNSLNQLYFQKYPQKKLNDAWDKLAFNQFHDILPGSSIFEANQDALANYKQVERIARETKEFAFRNMADHIRLKKDQGQPVVAFNFQPYQGKTLVEAEVFTYDRAFAAEVSHWADYYAYNNVYPIDRGQGKFPTVRVTDNEGNSYTAQIVSGKQFPPGFRMKVLFVVDEIPAGGYKAFYVNTSDPGERAEAIPYKNNTFETDYFTIGINPESGRVANLIDRKTGKEYANGELNTLLVYNEDKGGGMKAWSFSRFNSIESMKTDSVKVVEMGPVRACVESHRSWGRSRIIERCYIYKSYPRIDYQLEVHWLETGSPTQDSPMLRAHFPLNLKNVRFSNQVPFAVLDRPVNGQETPAQRWVDVTDGTDGIALLNKTKYGHGFQHDTLHLTLMRSSSEPDYYPNLGRMLIDYALFPHTGDWSNGVWKEGDLFNNPVYASEPASLSQKPVAFLPAEASLYELSSPDVVLTGMKKAEDSDQLIIRLCEVAGKEDTITLRLPRKIKSAGRTDILERKLDGVEAPVVTEDSLQLKVKPFEVITIAVDL